MLTQTCMDGCASRAVTAGTRLIQAIRPTVRSGAIESKVNDGQTRIYRAGESWSEQPGALHSVSRNASKTKPAKLLAVFVLDTNVKTLTTPVK